MTTTTLLWGGTILAGVTGAVTAAYAVRVYVWRRANRPRAIEAAPVRLAIEATPALAEVHHVGGFASGTQRAVLAAADAAGLVNGPYEAQTPEVRSYLDPAADTRVRVLQPDYEGLDCDDEADADAWIASLEQAGYSVTRGQVALDRAYARVVNEDFDAFDRATTAAYEKVMAVGSREIIDWANDWEAYKEAHGVEIATIEIQGIREWIDNELAAETASSIIAEMAEGELDAEAAGLADAPH
jgi:hypothetical protein